MRSRPSSLLVLRALFALIALFAASEAAARCLAYEPSRVALTGELEMRKLPGPPNYRSVARGDRPENVYFVKLDAPVCVSGDPTSRLNSRSLAGVAEVQLIVSAVKGSSAVGKHMKIYGTLSGAQSGAHRTPVLLTVKEMREAK
jgi:hypothetical protein